MDEYPRQTTRMNPFSKGPTKNDGGRKGFFKGFRQNSEVVGFCSSKGGGGGTLQQRVNKRTLNEGFVEGQTRST